MAVVVIALFLLFFRFWLLVVFISVRCLLLRYGRFGFLFRIIWMVPPSHITTQVGSLILEMMTRR